MKKWLIPIILLVTLLIVIIISFSSQNNTAQVVRVEKVQKRDITARVKATGEVIPLKSVDISPKVMGEIKEIYVKEGDVVHKGQLLVRIEEREYRTAYEQAKIRLKQLQIELRRLELQLEYAKKVLVRTRKLLQDGVVQQDSYDSALLKYETLLIQKEEQEALIEQQQFAVKRAKENLDWTKVYAPMNGRVIDLKVEEGETAIPSSMNIPGSILMTIADMSTLLARVDVTEADVVQLKLNQPAEITIESLDTPPFPGHIIEIATSGEKDPQSGTIRYPVRIQFDKTSPDIRPGMTVRASIHIEEKKNALVVPLSAIQKRYVDDKGIEIPDEKAPPGLTRKNVVYVVENSRAYLRVVETGISDEVSIEILSGLKGNETVITGPYRILKRLQSGDRVKIKVRQKGKS